MRLRAAVFVLLCLAAAWPATSATLEDVHRAVRVRDWERAASLCRELAERGDAEASYELAVMLRNGQGTRKDAAEAAGWFRRAAEAGHVRAQYNLAHLLQNGLGVPADGEEALEWYRRAAAGGHARARQRLARLEERGAALPARIDTAAASADERLARAIGISDARSVPSGVRG